MDVIVRVIVRHHRGNFVFALSLVHHNLLPGVRPVLRDERRLQRPSPNILPSSRVLPAHRVSLKQHRTFIPQLNPIDMNRIPRNSNPIPPSSHGAVRRPPRLLQPESLHLVRRRRNRRLFKYRFQLKPSRNDVFQHLVVRLVPIFRAQIKMFPL